MAARSFRFYLSPLDKARSPQANFTGKLSGGAGSTLLARRGYGVPIYDMQTLALLGWTASVRSCLEDIELLLLYSISTIRAG